MQQEIKELTKKCDEIQCQQNRKFDDIEERQRYHEILIKNQNWEYSADRPSDEYWESIDEDEDDTAEEFLEQIEKQTEDLRKGSISDGIISISTSTELPYNNEFLPHWKEFATALEQYHYHIKCSPSSEDIKAIKFRLNNVTLPYEVIDILRRALPSTHFPRLVLKNNNLSTSGIYFALNYLKRHKCIELCLSGNALSMRHIKFLCCIVSSDDYPTPATINNGLCLGLTGCKGADIDGHEMLKMITTAGKNKLQILNMRGNSISTGGNMFLSIFLAENPPLKRLHLNGNELDDNDAVAIASALLHNKNLRMLNIKNNNFTSVGWEALGKAVFDNTSLNSAAGSNHTCLIDFPPNCIEAVKEINGKTACPRFFGPKHVRQKKVYSILSARNRNSSNVEYLEDMPVELLPRMMRFIQKYADYHVRSKDINRGFDDVHPLSIMFEILQRWDESLAAFEALSS